MFDPAVAYEAGAKTVLYAALLLVLGAHAVRWLLLPRAAGDLRVGDAMAVERAVAGLATAAAAAVTAATGLRAWTHTIAAFGLDSVRSWHNVSLIAFDSRWGHAWRLQAAAALALLAASAAARRLRAAWPAATLAALTFIAAMPLLGHAAGHPVRMVIDALHLLAAGIWLGALAVVAGETRGQMRLLILRRFSPLAFSGAFTVIATGVAAAWWNLSTVSDLWTAPYGRVLALKLAFVTGIALCGFTNWRRLRRWHAAAASSAFVIKAEAILAAAVVVVTAFLTEIGHP